MAFLGEIRLFAFGFAPKNWMPCEGQYLPIRQQSALFSVIGVTYGGDGINNFKLPDLRAKVVVGSGKQYVLGQYGGEEFHSLTVNEMASHRHTAVASSNNADVNLPEGHLWPKDMTYRAETNTKLSDKAIATAGNGAGHPNMAPFLALNYCICTIGDHYNPDTEEEYIGEIITASKGNGEARWLPCDGREVAISLYYKLFSVIGDHFGGDGRSSFKVPDLRGKAALSCGQGEGLTDYKLGETGGFETVTLTENQLPPHSHTPAAKKTGFAPIPNDKMVWAAPSGRPGPVAYASKKGDGINMNPAILELEGGDAPHNNMMPYLTMNFYIAYDGELPPRH